MVLWKKGSLFGYQGIESDTDGPKIDSFIIPSSQEDFGSQELSSSNDGKHVSPWAPLESFFGYAKVDDFDSSILSIKEYVFGFDVAVANIALMDMRYDFEQFRKGKFEILHKEKGTA